MDKELLENFNYLLNHISPRIQIYLNKLNENVINNTQEIRLRSNRPVVLVTHSGSCFVTNSGKTSFILSSNCIYASKTDITDTINKMCGYSLHNHYDDILNGYITLSNGSRVGITGTAVYDKNNVKGVKDIDGINIRIPRNIKGISDYIFEKVFKKDLSNLIIAGPPSSGKTTLLKDISYQLSSGRMGKYYKVCVVDERKEIISIKKDIKDIGPNTDVLSGFPKSQGISMAVRTLSPDVIICDEISSKEIDEIINGMNTGVYFILSIHARDIDELTRKSSYKKLVEKNCINNIIVLKSCNEPCVISGFYNVNGVNNETDINNINCDNYSSNSIELYKAN